MKNILFGTTNLAKIKQIRGALLPFNIQVYGIDKNTVLPEVKENGKTAIENACKKALAYAKFLNKPVFSMDNALYLDGLKYENQPGLNVRKIKDYPENPTDNQILEYYSRLIKKLGGKTNGYWDFGICIANPKSIHQEIAIRSPRLFVSTPYLKILPGYPLESIQIDPQTNKYIAEMTQEEQDAFWQKAIGKPLGEFVKSIDF